MEINEEIVNLIKKKASFKKLIKKLHKAKNQKEVEDILARSLAKFTYEAILTEKNKYPDYIG